MLTGLPQSKPIRTGPCCELDESFTSIRGLLSEAGISTRKESCAPNLHPRVAGRPLTQELREPGFVLDLFMQDRQGKVVGTVILAGGVVTDGGIAADSAPFSADQHLQHGLNSSGVLWQVGGRARRNVMKGIHTVRESATQFVDSRNKGFKMIAILDASIFSDFFQPFTSRPMRLTRKIV